MHTTMYTRCLLDRQSEGLPCSPADYCHRMGVANRDIKLENTLLDGSPKPLVKITDFGYCKSDQESLPKSKVGTPGYTGAGVGVLMLAGWPLI